MVSMVYYSPIAGLAKAVIGKSYPRIQRSVVCAVRGKLFQFVGENTMPPLGPRKVKNGWCKLHMPSTPQYVSQK
jgi:hypothetical protein